MRLHPEALAAVLAYCRAAPAAESCGALLGTVEGPTVRAAVEVANGAPDPVRSYAISAGRVRELDRQAAETGLAVVGFYHSHPAGPARPSAADLEAAWPGYIYLIVGEAGVGMDAPRAWRLADRRDRFEEVAIRMETTKCT
jgi:proteasome lid subunit RPN8/RPN11